MSKDSNELKKQDGFSSSFGFLFAAIAAAVGLSNIWRFSADAAANGGFVYVICYLFCVLAVGYPILLAELALGRTRQKGVYEAYADQGLWKWTGFFGAVVCFFVFCFYNIVAGWVVGYVWKLASGELGALETESGDNFDTFFKTLRENYAGNLIWTLIMVLGAVFINQAGVSAGIERCAKVLMPIFIVMMLGLIAYGCMLEGSGEGISYYLWPSWDKFRKGGLWKGVASALSQALMSLSIGMGAMVTYGAYVRKDENLHKSALTITVGDTLVAICAGLFLFAFLGATGGIVVGQEINGGEGLAFATLPYALLKHLSSPIVAHIVLGAFFLLLVFAAITSSISLLEVTTKYVESGMGISRKKSIWLMALSSYVISVFCILSEAKWGGIFSWFSKGEKSFLDFYINFVICVLIPLSTFLFSLFIAFKWKVESIFKESSKDKAPSQWFVSYMTISLKYVIPVLTGFSLLYSLANLFGFL